MLCVYVCAMYINVAIYVFTHVLIGVSAGCFLGRSSRFKKAVATCEIITGNIANMRRILFVFLGTECK